jgi:predicted HTH transcriptional regulator
MKEIQEKGRNVIISENIMKELAVSHLNVRQERIVRFLFLNERVDNEQCQVLCKSIKRTATRDLTGLVEKSILQKHGEKKGTYYFLAPEIENKIRDI